MQPRPLCRCPPAHPNAPRHRARTIRGPGGSVTSRHGWAAAGRKGEEDAGKVPLAGAVFVFLAEYLCKLPDSLTAGAGAIIPPGPVVASPRRWLWRCKLLSRLSTGRGEGKCNKAEVASFLLAAQSRLRSLASSIPCF